MSRGLYLPIMEIDIDPVYIKDENINLCTTVYKVYPGEIFGVQKITIFGCCTQELTRQE